MADFKILSPEQQQLLEDIRESSQKLHELIGRAESDGTAGECVHIAQRRLAEAGMWAEKGIRA